MNETTQAIGTLTTLDIKALRTADRVSFHADGTAGVIRATKEVKQTGPWEDRERSHQIGCESSTRVYSSNSNCGEFNPNTVRCYEMVYGINEEWSTIAGLLKAGDVISLEWWGANNSGNLNASRTELGQKLYQDELHVRVKRGDKQMRFLLRVSVCPNNTARMVKV